MGVDISAIYCFCDCFCLTILKSSSRSCVSPRTLGFAVCNHSTTLTCPPSPQMHPLGLCNNNDDEDLYEYGWVGVVKLEQPELDPSCLTVLGKVSTVILLLYHRTPTRPLWSSGGGQELTLKALQQNMFLMSFVLVETSRSHWSGIFWWLQADLSRIERVE